MLTDYGCDEAQGYYYGRPVPGSQMIAQLRDAQHGQEPGSVPAFLRTPLGGLAAVKGVMHVSA
jgi:predicted signal transduction protein with EAL and GGDEF domain